MNQYGNPTELVQAWKSLIAAADAVRIEKFEIYTPLSLFILTSRSNKSIHP